MKKSEHKEQATYNLMEMEDAFRLVTDFLLGKTNGTITVLAAPYAYQVTVRRRTLRQRRPLPPR